MKWPRTHWFLCKWPDRTNGPGESAPRIGRAHGSVQQFPAWGLPHAEPSESCMSGLQEQGAKEGWGGSLWRSEVPVHKVRLHFCSAGPASAGQGRGCCAERSDLLPFPAIQWGRRVHTLTLSLKGVQDVPTRPVERLSNFPVTNLPYLFCSNRLIVSSKRLRCSGMRSPETCLNNCKHWSWASQKTANQLLRLSVWFYLS